MNYSIYLPPQYFRPSNFGVKTPLLFWLSGTTCDDQNFVLKAGAQKYAAEKGIALVCPDTSPRGEHVPSDPDGAWDFGYGAGFYINATQAPWANNYCMYDYVADELPALVFDKFQLDKQRMSIFGHSMGGYGALMIGLKNTYSFKSISALAPLVSPLECTMGQKAFSRYLGGDQTTWGQYDICQLLSRASVQLPVLIDQGDQDEFLEEQLKTSLMVKASEKSGYEMQIRFQPGYDHSYFFISSFISEHIEFHSRYLL